MFGYLSHLGYGQTSDPIADVQLDPQMRTELINEVLATIKSNYYSVEIADKMDAAIRQKIAKREYDAVTSAKVLAVVLTMHLQEICRDKHLTVQIADLGESDSSRADAERTENFGFTRIEILPENIGYLRINAFPPPELAGETLGAAMKFVQNTDALIIDLRHHTGGAIPMVALAVSYFLPENPVRLLTVDAPRNQQSFESWTVEKLTGPRYLGKPVYLLTSRETFSGGEEFAYDLQALRRAEVVGERTKGGANPVRTFLIQNIFRLSVSFAQVKNSVTGTNWEGKGVQPDIETSSDGALDTALERAKKILREKGPIAQTAPVIKGSQLPEISGFPDTPIGKTFQIFIDALNSGNREKLVEFHLMRLERTEEGKRIAEENAKQDLDFFQNSGGIIPRKIVSSTVTKIELIAQLKQRNEWILFTMEIDQKPPHAIVGINVKPAQPLK
jgi:hypothetical protein